MGSDLEPALFQGLTAIVRIEAGVGRPAPELPTVGMVAEEMSIDPSRASRIASTLIGRGYVAREAAQQDGRISVLRLTDKGRAALRELRDRKWVRLMKVFSGWTEEDIACFSRLFGRYACEVTAADEG
jgi:DNA-binding MarR family transcriptional regulator